MSEIVTRALTGAVYVALTLGAAFAGPIATMVLFLPVCAIAAREFHRLGQRNEQAPSTASFVMFQAVVLYTGTAALSIVPSVNPWMVAAAALVLFSAGALRMLLHNHADPLREMGEQLAALCYIALPFGLVTHFLDGGPYKFIGFMIMLWTNDTGAYLVGRAVGRTKLMPAISPKKTIEGLIGGIALTMAVAAVLAHAWPVLNLVQWLACAVVVSILSTLGDLLESALKRARGVKDSGTVLPGHGGILDRFDGFLLAAPGMLVCIHLFA